MSTANKLAYLNGTKQAIKQAINEDFEVIDNNTTFREYADEISSNNAKYKDLIPKETKNATNTLDISNSSGLDKALVTQYGNTYQEGEPTPDSPQEIQVVTGDNTINICGKNIINIPNRTYTNSTISVVANDGVLTINGTNSTTGNIIVEFTGINNYTTNQNITMVRNGDDISDGNAQLFLTVDGTEYNMGNQTSHPDWRTLSYSGTITRLRLRIAPGASYTNFKIKPMLYLGDYDSSILFEPYKGASYPIYLGVENLWKNQLIGFLPQSGSYPTTNSSYPNARYILIDLLAGQSITLSGSTSQKGRIRCIDKDTNQVVNYFSETNTQYYETTSRLDNGFNKATITAKKEFIVGIMDIGGSVNDLIVNYGATPQYISDTPIELCKIGNYKDRIYPLNGKWYLEKKIGKVVLDGSESGWHTSSLSVTGYKSYYVDSSVRINQEALGSKCNYFEYKTYNEWLNLLKATFIENTYQAIGIRVIETLAPTLEDFKTWLSTHNTIAYFVLATPTTEEITENNYPTLYNQLNNIKLFEGVNHITMTNESGLDVEFDITYYKDWKLD